MGKLSVGQLLTLVDRSGLVEPERLAPLVAQWNASAGPESGDARACADHLVRAGVLTAWQAEKLLEGRHRGFLLGSYRLLDHLARGGMSNVYLAEHRLMQRRVAIKVLPQNRVADASFLARFQLEAKAVAALDHKNIVRAYDLGHEGSIHYLVMEYVEGNNLEELVAASGRLNAHAAADYVAQAAAGLAHAHVLGLVHRDVKPANLLVDRQGTIKILDMGLAKFEGQGGGLGFADDEVVGTAEYLAPEQAARAAVDERADIYSLGCTLYFLLAGHAPFERPTTAALLSAHQHGAAPALEDVRPDVPAGLAAICRRMMEKDPANRYQSAEEVGEALTSWLESERGRRPLSGGSSPAPDPQTAATVEPRAASHGPPSAPPVVSPPRDVPFAAIPSVVPAASQTSEPADFRQSPQFSPGPIGAHWSAASRLAATRRRANWLWPAILAALVVVVVLLALFAFLR
jgi:serine/threonine-protein kinase